MRRRNIKSVLNREVIPLFRHRNALGHIALRDSLYDGNALSGDNGGRCRVAIIALCKGELWILGAGSKCWDAGR